MRFEQTELPSKNEKNASGKKKGGKSSSSYKMILMFKIGINVYILTLTMSAYN